MRRKDLTYTQKIRFGKSQKCCICGESIYDYEEIILNIYKIGRYKKYEFYHKRCLNGKKQKEEKEKSEDC